MKFRTCDPNSEAGLLLWNRYVFFYKVEKVSQSTPFFFLTYPLKKKYYAQTRVRDPGVLLDPPCESYINRTYCFRLLFIYTSWQRYLLLNIWNIYNKFSWFHIITPLTVLTLGIKTTSNRFIRLFIKTKKTILLYLFMMISGFVLLDPLCSLVNSLLN